MLSPTKKSICLLAATAHFALVIIGACELELWDPMGPVGSVLTPYSKASGASAGYGFFAPGVGSQLQARFFIETANGEKREVDLERHSSHEADLRTGNVIGWFWNEGSDSKVKRSLAASWAGKIFGRHPEAHAVTVKVESYQLVSMEEFRNGRRPGWKDFYSGKFVHRGRKAGGE